ncbi:MAG: hypothetical protein M3463_06815 [Verrucomicrobiota bacterium]|nr:hypothetical protein [Verrucomicrobiota bacterium]
MSKYTAFRCPEDLLELAKSKAKKDRRSLSNYIITLIEKDVAKYLPREQPLTFVDGSPGGRSARRS